MEEKIAIIDLGTNTFHLLIARATASGYFIQYRERLAVKLGQGGINAGIITDEGMHRALVAMQSFKNKIDQQGVTRTFAFGTSALRNAGNQQRVLQEIKELTNIEVTVIDGDREAEFIYYGVCSALGLGDDRSLIVDIGGGSVEFIIGNQHTIFWKQSVEIGAQRLLEKYHKHDPITQEEISLLNAHFQEKLLALDTAIKTFKPEILVGSSGTFDTLSDIFCLQHHIARHDDERETQLSISGFYEIYRELIGKNREQRMAIPGMIEMRVDMIVVACCLIHHLLEMYSFKNIRVSSYALKEGALAWLNKTLKK